MLGTFHQSGFSMFRTMMVEADYDIACDVLFQKKRS